MPDNETYKIIAKSLTKDLEDNYTDEQMRFIENRLMKIAEENDLTSDNVAYYCDANSSEMFSCIFDYKNFDKTNFITE